jgi:hypothetical protein
MRCYICNHVLKSHEIVVGKTGSFEPCHPCRGSSALPSDDDLLLDTDFIEEEDEND